MTRSAEVPPRAIPRGPVQRSRRHWRRAARAAGGTLVISALAGVGITVADRVGQEPAAPTCAATDAGVTYGLTPEQAANAAIISGVAVRSALPAHAVTVALATALQESKLRNLPYGDRDSLGLFQQRPSQGWGTAAQVADPQYAAGAFYRALVKLPGWQTADVATAAQEVQRSADGSAYAGWEGEARALAIALTGQRPATFTCSGGSLSTGRARTTTTAGAVAASVTGELGAAALRPGSDTGLGWAAASTLVATSQADGTVAVAYGGYRWTAAAGTWTKSPTASSTVEFTLAPPVRG